MADPPTDDSSTSTADTTETADTTDTTGGTSMDPSGTSEVDSGSSTTEAGLSCGNGVVEGIEDCDGAELLGATCESLGFDLGTLACDADCVYDYSGCVSPPLAPTLTLSVSAIKQLDFSWGATAGTDHYQLEERAAPGEPFVQVGGDVVGESLSLTVPLHLRHQASYRLRACNAAGCTTSGEVAVMSSLAEAVGYFKASVVGTYDDFGTTVAISDDGNTLAVGAPLEDSNSTGIDGDDGNDLALYSGAVWVFVRDDEGGWSQQAYVKASNTGASHGFGTSLALSADGSTLVVGAAGEPSNATGIDGNQANSLATGSGAVYVFVRDVAGAWSQQAYVKASNTDAYDAFGTSVALSDDGDTLAVGAPQEDSTATGIDGDQTIDFASAAGAVYVFGRDGVGAWSQHAYVKASNTDYGGNLFGTSVALSGDGQTLAVGAHAEDSDATGINGNQLSDPSNTFNAGAVYVFTVNGMGAWSQQAYVKASNTGSGDRFGASVALSGTGDTLAVGAPGEYSNATGIDGNQADDSSWAAGATYVFVRDGLGAWSQQAYVKASNTSFGNDEFGWSVALAADGDTLVVGAHLEDGNATGIGGDQANELAEGSGAAYVLVRDGLGAWSQRAYVKAPNTAEDDRFTTSVALSGDGTSLAIGAPREDSNATGVGGDQANDVTTNAGAVYLY